MGTLMPILLLCALLAGACAAPMPPSPTGPTVARASPSVWWLCDPPGLWEDRR